MRKLRFGTRARKRHTRRTRLKRLGIIAWAFTVLFGFPGADLQVLDLVSDRGGYPELSAASISGTESISGLLKFRRGVFDSRPRPTPSPTEEQDAAEIDSSSDAGGATAATQAPSGSISEVIYAAAAEFGLDGSYLLSVAQCESSLNPQATNPAGYYGLFQFDQQTWAAYGYGSIYDPAAQARTAARLIAAGQASRWPNCA